MPLPVCVCLYILTYSGCMHQLVCVSGAGGCRGPRQPPPGPRGQREVTERCTIYDVCGCEDDGSAHSHNHNCFLQLFNHAARCLPVCVCVSLSSAALRVTSSDFRRKLRKSADVFFLFFSFFSRSLKPPLCLTPDISVIPLISPLRPRRWRRGDGGVGGGRGRERPHPVTHVAMRPSSCC